MKKFIIEIITLCLASLLIWGILDIIVTNGLRKSRMIIFENLTKLVHGEINADLIINGSSKAYVQISPMIIDSCLQLNSFNLGLDGTPFIPQKMQFELYEKFNTKPRIVIQIVSNHTFQGIRRDFKDHIKFAPYLNYDLVKETMKLYNGFSLLDYYLPLIRYAGQPIEIMEGILCEFKVHLFPSPLQKGYLANDMVWDKSFEEFKIKYKDGYPVSLDEISCNYFEEYMKNCQEEGIELYLVYPPMYYESVEYIKNREKLIDYYERVSLKYDATFLNFSVCELSFAKEYFYNSQHLNKKGSEIFTKELCDKLKEISPELNCPGRLNN